MTLTATAPTRRQKIAAERRALDKGEHHRVPHQLNAVVLDVDSAATGYGEHSRLVGPFGPASGETTYTLREDLCSGLPESTEDQRERVLYGWGALTRKGALVHVSSVRYGGDRCGGRAGSGCPAIEHTYVLRARA